MLSYIYDYITAPCIKAAILCSNVLYKALINQNLSSVTCSHNIRINGVNIEYEYNPVYSFTLENAISIFLKENNLENYFAMKSILKTDELGYYNVIQFYLKEDKLDDIINIYTLLKLKDIL